jgi:hypothetical protein
LSDGQLELIHKVAEAAGTNRSTGTGTTGRTIVVTVVLTAGAVDLTPLLNNSNIGAILQAGQPSVAVLGVGDVMFGKRAQAGRMVQTVYPSSFVDEISLFDMNMRPGLSAFPPAPGEPGLGVNPGRTHRFYTKKPVLPFGFALSYTTWRYNTTVHIGSRGGHDRGRGRAVVALQWVQSMLQGRGGGSSSSTTDARSANRVTAHPALLQSERESALVGYTVNVTNTGSRDSDHVVLGMITPPGAGTVFPSLFPR